MSRFEHENQDGFSGLISDQFKFMVESLEYDIEAKIHSPRAKALALTKLEECFMWICKAIRDDQASRDQGKS